MRNTLYYGDNLTVLRDQHHFPDAGIDLIYLDPPFNSNRSYNVLFKEETGKSSDAQIKAFDDTWHWPGAVETYHELVTETGGKVGEMIGALHSVLGGNQMMAYLVMMAARLVELHRVLKPTGSLYLHCDPTASHYLKVVMDCIFEVGNFRNEVSWRRSAAHNDTRQGMRRYGRVRDVVLFYTKGSQYIWNPQFSQYGEAYRQSEYRHVSGSGRPFKETDLTAAKPGGDTEYDWHVKRPVVGGERWQADVEAEHLTPRIGWEYKSVRPYQGRYWAYSKANLIGFAESGYLIHRETGMPRLVQYADEMPGVALQDLWTDIQAASGNEYLGYPTQKPVALLERIINASSNPGDVVLDPFCGCGTTVVAAQKLGRTWLGIDITHLSTSLLKSRLFDSFGLQPKRDYDVVGEPVDSGGAKALADQDKFQFQFWALSLIAARPQGAVGDSKQGKKGSDKGIDGTINFIDDASDKPKRVIVQVKGGGVKSGDIRDLVGTLEREKGAIGVFITLEPPTSHMINEAASAGLYASPGWHQNYPRIQIYTIAQLLAGAQVKMPRGNVTFKRAQREDAQGHQPGLGLE